VALRELQDTQGTAAYVVDRRRVLQGTVYDTDLVTAQRRGDRTLEQVVRPDNSAVSPDTPMSEMFAPAAEAALPIAVTDEEGRLVGVVPRVKLLEAMVPPESPDSAASPDPAATQSAAAAPAPPGTDQAAAAGGNEALSSSPVPDQSPVEGENR